MLRAGVAAIALVALANGSPTPTRKEGLEARQWEIGNPWTTIIVGGSTPTAVPTSGPGIGPPITGGLNPPREKRDDGAPSLGWGDSDALKAHIVSLELEYEHLVQEYGDKPPPSVAKREKEIEKELKEYGIIIVQTPDGTSTTITFGKVKRQGDIGPVLGGSDPSALKKYLTALELEYEALVHQFGNNPPSYVAKRKKEIETELKKYGIAIIATPDGTSTIITPGKARRGDPSLDAGAYGSAGYDLAGLEKTLESLWQQYGTNPPHEVYIVEEKIKHILLAYGITVVQAPDGTSTVIYPSTRRSFPDYDIEKLESIFESLLQEYNGERPPLDDWLVIQHTAAVLKSYGISIEQYRTDTKRSVPTGDSVNVVALQALLALLEATYGSSPPLDIYLIEQTIATILGTQGIIVPGFPIPGGAITPDPTIPGGVITPDPTIPGGSITPDPTVPGGSINPSTKKRDNPDVEGLLAALAQLEAAYGSYGSGSVPVAVFIIMQNIVTILQADGVSVPGWPDLGGGSTVIGPST
ncbi:hypothetical protein PFICI_00446 [Pestalotiopsis fici W106-1]|uniref:Uncharacterized protein n=1 Tax=Pestalotiopsis fici (strain W106-1 / CGMCC3.15140) TaxID=1229662 RepID=W3XKN2_PESFW|nr:uncharacterized protein PFICI_00446 [Pestalotiopsis fici W106-1]ETS86618.1 hypothetical protein PFICI_00446 [Pestalotiopsis fici W106-1]